MIPFLIWKPCIGNCLKRNRKWRGKSHMAQSKTKAGDSAKTSKTKTPAKAPAKVPAKAPVKAPAKAAATKATKAAKPKAPAKAAVSKSAKATKGDAGILNITISAAGVQWTISPKIYPLDVVYQAAFVFIDRAYLMLDEDAKGNIVVSLKGKEALSKPQLEALQGEFANELLNQAVRRTLSKQNRRLRELIVAKALFAASRPDELREIMNSVSRSGPGQGEAAPRPWDQATAEEQDELDKLLAEIEQDFADDPMGIAVPWDEKYGDKKGGGESAE
jgi:His-Xaa-Ser system protein HxsD